MLLNTIQAQISKRKGERYKKQIEIPKQQIGLDLRVIPLRLRDTRKLVLKLKEKIPSYLSHICFVLLFQ